VTALAAPPLPAELDALLRRMRLPYMRSAAPDVLATARAQRWEPAEVLRVLLAEEVTGRDAATRRMRRKSAAFPSGKTFSSWRPGESSIPEATQNALITLEWIGRAENLVIAGPSGTGKSHFAEAVAHAAIEKDLRVAWFTLETLTAAIGKAKADGSVARTARICRSDLVVVDDIGMLPAGQDAAEAFYRITDAAYERRSVTVTSNIHPSKAHMFARTCVRRCRNITGSAVWRDGVPARRCAAPGVRCEGMETPTWRGIRSLRTCSRPRRSL
jgi:DNA replication protein DnaC